MEELFVLSSTLFSTISVQTHKKAVTLEWSFTFKLCLDKNLLFEGKANANVLQLIVKMKGAVLIMVPLELLMWPVQLYCLKGSRSDRLKVLRPEETQKEKHFFIKLSFHLSAWDPISFELRQDENCFILNNISIIY